LSVPVIFYYLSLVSCLVLVGKGAGDV